MYPLVNHESTGAQIAWTVPPILSTAIMVAIGNKIAEMAKPIIAIFQKIPDISPIRGGKHEISCSEKHRKHSKPDNKGTCICIS